MKNHLEGKNGAAVLEELIRQLKENENICRMLGDLGARNADVLATQLIDELERIIKWQHLQHELTARTTAPAGKKTHGARAIAETFWASCSKTPQLIAGGRRPRPIKLKPVSLRIMPGIERVRLAII